MITHTQSDPKRESFEVLNQIRELGEYCVSKVTKTDRYSGALTWEYTYHNDKDEALAAFHAIKNGNGYITDVSVALACHYRGKKTSSYFVKYNQAMKDKQ